jgi:two-component system nitrate/nitrite response regulator NarL
VELAPDVRCGQRDRDMVSALVCAEVRLYREGLADALARSGRIDVVGAVSRPAEALVLAAELDPDVVLFDVSTLRGDELGSRMRALVSRTTVVALGVPEQEEHVIACAESGVAAFVTRETSLDELVAAIESVVTGDMLCSPQVAGTLLRRVRTLAAAHSALATATLTMREVQILDLIVDGLSNKEIALRLNIELSTAKNHVHSILGKLNVRRRSDAAVARAREI